MPHYVTAVIENGERPRLQFTCDEPEGALCRIICPTNPANLYGCEQLRVDWIDGKPWHVGWSEEADDEIPLHEMVPYDRCTILEWDSLDECFGGEGEMPIGVKAEIKFMWSDDEYPDWDFAAPVVLPEPEEPTILDEIKAERDRAEAKFPDQHLPNGTSDDMWGGDCIAAKALCDSKLKHGGLTWREVLYEEVTEAFCEEDPTLLRAELIQVGAMAVRWIDRASAVPVDPTGGAT